MQPLDDLLWAVNSPPLLSASPLVDHVDVGEIDLDHFAKFLREQSDHRVGRYFERLILYWLTHIRKVQIVHHSKQILDAKRTIGEIDFIFRRCSNHGAQHAICRPFVGFLAHGSFRALCPDLS